MSCVRGRDTRISAVCPALDSPVLGMGSPRMTEGNALVK